MSYVFLVFIPIGLVVFTKHIACYRQAVQSLKARGVSIDDIDVRFYNYGSVGCIRKVKKLQQKYASELNNSEIELLKKSSMFYTLQAPIILLFIVAVVAVSSLERGGI